MASAFSIGVSFSPRSRTILVRKLQQLPKTVQAGLREATAATALAIYSEAFTNVARATEDVANSLSIRYFSGGLSATVGATDPAAPFLELGTSPHERMPPREDIEEWLGEQGEDPRAAWPIMQKVAAEGTPAQPFLGPAIAAQRYKYAKRCGELVQRYMKRLQRT